MKLVKQRLICALQAILHRHLLRTTAASVSDMLFLNLVELVHSSCLVSLLY